MKMKVNRNQLIAGLIMVPLMLSGCGSKPAANEAAADTKGAAAAPAQGQNGQQAAGDQKAQSGNRPERTAMNENELRLRTTSQSLIAIDKSEGLAFTKQQAEQLLPLAEAAVTKKELTAEQQDAMLKLLTAEQTKLYQTRADQMKQRMGGAGGAGNGGTPPKEGMTQEQRDAMKEQRQAQGGGQGAADGKGGGRMQNPGNGSAGGNGDASAQGGAGAGGEGGPGAGGSGGGGANGGQQLVDLLKERIK